MSEPTQDRSVSRRRFLKFAAIAATTAAVVPALQACSQPAAAPAGKPSDAAKPAESKPAAPAAQAPAAAPTAARVVPGQAGAAAPAGKTSALTFMQENCFIKGFDDYFTKTLAPEYQKQTGIEVHFDGISVGGIQAKITAAVETNAGPETAMQSFNWPQLYAQKLVDVSDIADRMGAQYGGWKDVIKEAVVVDGRWKALPVGNIGQLMVYRVDWFKEAGVDEFPQTWDELLEVGKRMKARGRPFGFEYGHGFGDNHGWMYPLLWSYGGREVDQDGKTVVLDSDETARAVDWARKFFEEANLQDVLGWTDVNNNKAFLGEQISATNNASSILTVANNEFPAIAPHIGHALNPVGPKNERFHMLNPWSYSAFTFAPDVEAAKAFLQWLVDERQFSGRLVAADAYFAPFLNSFDTHPMWDNDPRMKPFKESVQYSHLPGWPGPGDRRASESLAKYVIADMFAGAASGKSTKEVIATATGQLKQIYGTS
jgi:multiple sugar transport system substrate-binding protein